MLIDKYQKYVYLYNMLIQNKRLKIILLVCSFMLLLPLIAMQFTNEVKWTLPDFIIGGLLLFGVGLASELILRKIKSKNYRLTTLFILIILLLLIWAELAVGILGSPFAGS